MAIYTYVGNKRLDDFTSRLIFSTGKDMVVGEAIDLTAQEIAEAGKLQQFYSLQTGTVVVNITHQNFPPIQMFARKGTSAVASTPYHKA